MILSRQVGSEERDLYEVIERVLDKGIVVDAAHRLRTMVEADLDLPLVVTLLPSLAG